MRRAATEAMDRLETEEAAHIDGFVSHSGDGTSEQSDGEDR